MQKGILYGVSTGPGDPELMTIKAVKCIEKAEVLAAPRTRGKNCMALEIVKGILDLSEKKILYLDFSMKKDSPAEAEARRKNHKKQAAEICKYLDEGKDVAMLNIGDASLFGTFGYIKELVKAAGYEGKVIPGVPSFCAAAASLGQSLTVMDAPLTVLPGTFQELEEGLRWPGSKVIMKPASALPEVIEILEKNGMSARSSMAVNVGLSGERLYPEIRMSEGKEGYFSTILVRAEEKS